MVSRSLNPNQLTLELDAQSTNHPDLLACMAACVYRRGLTNVATALDVSHGNLSVKLARADRGEKKRRFSLEEFERYLERTGDYTPIYYLVGKYLRDQQASRDLALERVQQLLSDLPQQLIAAGLPASKGGRR